MLGLPGYGCRCRGSALEAADPDGSYQEAPMDRTAEPAGRLSRRQFAQRAARLGLSAAGLTVLAGCGSRVAPNGPSGRGSRLETATLRIGYSPAICFAAMYVAEDLLRSEGFSELHYVRAATSQAVVIAGEADLAATDIWSILREIDQGRPLTVLSGLHGGCYDLYATGQIRAIRDLKGKALGVPGLHAGRHLFLSTIVSYVGLQPGTDITWVTAPSAESIEALADGRIDAFLAFPPEPQELRARQIGHLVVSTAHDRPWSDYLCCFVFGHSDFVRRHPEATKRALRAIIKANEICVNEPDRTARLLVDRGYTPRFDYALQTIKEVPTPGGASSTPRTPFASTATGCTNSG